MDTWISGDGVFRLYVLLKVHFSKKNKFQLCGINKEFPIDFLKNVSPEAFEKRNDKNFFEILGKKLKTKETIIGFFTAFFLRDENGHVSYCVAEEEKWDRIYHEWLRNINNIEKNFKSDLEKIIIATRKNKQFYKNIIDFVISKKITLESFCILNAIFENVEEYKKELDKNLIHNYIMRHKVHCYTNLFSFGGDDVKKKYKAILKTTLEKFSINQQKNNLINQT